MSQELADTERDAIRQVITAQIEAFQCDDGIQAFLYAAPAIRQQFKSVGNFMRMVRSSYPAVYRPRGVIFGELTEMQGFPAQSVFLMAQEGEIVKAIYLMQQQPSKDWRIAGCFLVPVEEI
ncbi:DUF4864 domain-containing protein [Oscillatoria sp. CS-180]|uniref:DUF4864 domain-containing protein n=1 Tax=Oscillatoria sp. CS-180 TaxID=3021720 RepID=UPI00232B8FD8|nr:DUF4864 domain-containing protein [Oscillatoria sp. CS-180]MDB9528519.1 DUF4864 domain-containing protein [Oscillatoria sp. CS-180]